MAYLHCPSCERTAWLDSTAEPALLCHHCDTALTAMPAGSVRTLVGAVRERFEQDAVLDAGRPRFVRD
jgi:ribosomal protein S27E